MDVQDQVFQGYIQWSFQIKVFVFMKRTFYFFVVIRICRV